MTILMRQRLRRASIGLAMLLLGPATTAAPPPATLLDEMQEAIVPSTAQLSRVRVSVTKELEPDASLSWDVLVARKRFADGPRTAISIMNPDAIQDAAVLTAPDDDGRGLGLWLYSPSERRARQLAPLEPDRHFLRTDFSYDDLGLTRRELTELRLLGEAGIAGTETWKIDAVPADEGWYYSHITTWIAKDTKLPVRREYYDRAERLWKIVTFQTAMIEDVPTILGITLEDVQSRSVSEWRIEAISYRSTDLDKADLSADSLFELAGQSFWRAVGIDTDDSVASVD